jgi:hypothetical protein
MDLLQPTEVLLTKKGTVRKRKPKKSNNYFTEDTQNAIVEYVLESNEYLRNKIYSERIEYAFFKLTQNIIHTFKFHYTDGESVEDIQQEVICFLLEKLKMYKPNKGKAYSYFGTIVKRYLIVKNETNYKKLQNKKPLEDVDEEKSILDNHINKYYSEDYKSDDLINLYKAYLKDNIPVLFKKETDQKISYAFLSLLDNCDGIDIFNKKAIYIYLRDMTNYDTPVITRTIKKLKDVYLLVYNKYYN